MSNMSKTQLINSDASANTNSANSHIELVPGGSAETGPDSVSSTHTQVTNLTSTTVNGPSTSSSSSSPREERLAPPITSADLDSQPVQNILSSVSVQSTSGVCLQVELHDGTVYNVDSKDNPTVVEDLCIQLLKRYFPKMGPAAVQLFGLASIDKKQIPKMLWVNPCITIEELKRHIMNSPTAGGKNTFFLRIRYVPGRKFLHNLPALGPEILKYLYLQCKDDFVKSRLSDIYEQDIKNEAKARGYAVLSIVIASKMEEEDCQDILNKQKLEAFLPSHLVVRLCRGYQLRKIMKTKTEEFLAQHSNTKVEELLMGYIKDVLNEVQSYGVERYEAKKVSGSLRPVHITLDVQQHEENGNTQYKGLFIDNEFFSSIDDFRSIHITPNHADQKKLSWNVHLDRSNGCPEVLRFDSKTVAESFVSGVNGYYRLITDYYMNLSQQMELPSLQEINRLKCHGPIDTSTAVRKLKTKYLSDEYYILKQSMQVFDQLAILFCYGGQTRKGLIDKKENMYCLEGENEEEFKDINCLIKYMAETRNLLPKRPIKFKPQQEPVDVLRKLFVEEIIPDDDEEAATNNQRRKPYIILPEEIKIKELIERGTFTEVFVCDLESGTLHAAKRLRQTSNDQMFRCYEHFQHAVQQLIRMEDPKFFVRVHGLVLSTPPMLVMEKAQYGSLASFFRRRQTSQPIKPFHLLNAASQVAQGMLFLNEHQLVHGNLCCRNLLVFRYEIDDILVKIGDPGMVSLMNSLDLSLPQNRSRLLFLAPELYPDCRKCDSKMTQQSDVFAFGTTLWEMFAHGQNPVETRKLKNLSNLEILQTPAHTRLDPPRSLDEATEWKRKVLDLMSLCWKPVEDRPAPNLLLRDLRTQVADYDSSQRGHGYSSIRREFEDDIQDQGRDGNAVPDLISSTQESQPIRPMLSPTLPPVNAAFIPPAPFMPTPSRASLNTESLSNKAGGVYNRSLPELPLDFKYIISSRRLQIQEKQLGSGHYGVVKEGMLFASQDDRSNPQKIAAKELKGDFQNVIDSEEFKEEAVLMSKLEHDNVVKFLGISDNMLILEYVEKGALNMYLRKFRKQNTYLPVWRLMKMISDVAQGMAYLASMRVIHCDLAGRNVLLTDKLVAKITDFGLAKILQKDKDYYTRSTGKELPLMWCSPESIANRKFTTKGDIWSYGILMWEVFTHAKPPVLCNNFSKEGFKKLEEGKRLKRPTHCPELVYQFMEKCWKFKPEERPDFNEACQSCREFAKIYPEPEQRVPETYRFEPIQSEKLKELLNSFKVEFPDDLSSESFIHQILQDDMLKTLVTAVKSLSKGIMLTKNINKRRHDMPNVGACVFEVDVVFDGDQFSVIRKDASSNDFFNVNEEYLTRVILIKSKSLPVVDAKLLVYKKYKHVINRRKIVLQHEYEEFDDVAKCIAYQILSSFCTFVESVINAFTMDLHTIISDYPVESLTVEKIKRLCEEVFERIEDETIGAFESKRDWRRWVADEIGRIIRRKGEPVCSDAWVEIKNISQKTVKDLNAILTELEEFQTCVLPVDQNKQVEEWLKRDVILDKSVFKMHPSIIKYITGYKDRDDKKRVVKVYLHGDDKKAENFFKECCKISTDTYFEFVNVERSKGGNKEVEELKQRERKAPVVDNSTRKQLKQIIQEYGDKIYARHSNVVGIRIGKARRVGDTIQEQPCLVLYCLDKFLVPFGEKPLPEAIAGWPCDIREDFVRFGICPDRCLASSQNLPDPGCSIGIPSDDSSGSVGFLIESKDPLHTFEFGFLTASHVAVKRFEQLYHDEKLLSMHYLKLNDHCIVHPSWIDNGRNDHRIGKVVESFCGNYGLNKIGLDFAVIASSYCRNGAGKETLKVAKEEDLIMEKDIVTKTGRTTGTTKGCLMDDSLTVKVDRSFLSRGYFAFFNCYAIEDYTDDEPFFLKGDSGSGVYVMENGKPSKPLGIAFAYLDSQTAVCNIGMILDKLDLQIVKYLESEDSLKTFEESKISEEKTEEKSEEPMEES